MVSIRWWNSWTVRFAPSRFSVLFDWKKISGQYTATLVMPFQDLHCSSSIYSLQHFTLSLLFVYEYEVVVLGKKTAVSPVNGALGHDRDIAVRPWPLTRESCLDAEIRQPDPTIGRSGTGPVCTRALSQDKAAAQLHHSIGGCSAILEASGAYALLSSPNWAPARAAQSAGEAVEDGLDLQAREGGPVRPRVAAAAGLSDALIDCSGNWLSIRGQKRDFCHLWLKA